MPDFDFFLPPNLAASAPRDAIGVKVQPSAVNASVPLPQPLATWCQGRPPWFLQLTRAQLRLLLTALAGEPSFYWINQPSRPLAWENGLLPGVSEHLEAAAEPAPTPESAAPAQTSRSCRHLPPPPPAQPALVDGSEHFLAITLPAREHPSYAEILDLVKLHGFKLEPSNRKWWLRDRHKTLNFLATYSTAFRERFDARFTPNFEKNTAAMRPIDPLFRVETDGSEFQVEIGLDLKDESSLRGALAGGRHYVETDGRILLLDPDKMQRLEELQRSLARGGPSTPGTRRVHRLRAAELADAESLMANLNPSFEPPAAWRQKSGALRNLSRLEPAPVPEALDRQLRSYQRIGAAWMHHLFQSGLGGILADEMGLGKTVQSLALLAALHARQPRRPSLVVCPASLVENWRREAARFVPQFRVFAHHGASRLASAEAFASVDLVVTSYATLTRDAAVFEPVRFRCVIADEAQHVKNRRTQHAKALRSLQAEGRFLLTGTPVENRLDDLRALFDFILPGYLQPLPSGLRADERSWHDRRLLERSAPYLLRRTKKAVAPELPEKIEQVVYCELPPAQRALYLSLREKTEREIFEMEMAGRSEGQIRMAALTQLLRLRQLCCDPRLVDSGAAEIGSAKLEAFRELLEEAVDDGHRLLVFSQFVSVLRLLREELDSQAIPYCYLDGTTVNRQDEVDRFQNSADISVFLLSLKAGGTGLNLAAADTVVHFDPWWNPAVEAQATDRAHRIGQTRVVTSYKLIASDTIEERVLALQQSKAGLLQDLFEESTAANASISLADLKDLLKS